MHNSVYRMVREKKLEIINSHASLLAWNSYHCINLASTTAVEIVVVYFKH